MAALRVTETSPGNLAEVNVNVIVLNGGSSSGKSSLAACLQRQLEGTWLTLGIDDLIRALSFGPSDSGAGGSLTFGPHGSIAVSDKFRQAEVAWRKGMAAIANTGTGVIIDDVFLDGESSQALLAEAIEDLAVVWVGVRCDPDVAEAREIRRGDRIQGLARDQALRVHQGVRYDIIVDTTMSTPDGCAEAIIEYVTTHLP